MKKLAIILGLAFSLAAMQSTFADDGSAVCPPKCKASACKACGKKKCTCEKSDTKDWNYGKFQKH